MAINDQNFKTDNSNNNDETLKPGWQILLVEDSLINQEVARDMLMKMDCNVHIAANGLEAITALEQQRFDLILMDCNMPELDGYAATRKIRELEKQQSKSSIPIIAFTTEVMPTTREGCFAAGMDDFLPKPLIFKNLKKMLKTWLENQNVKSSEVQGFGGGNSANTAKQAVTIKKESLLTDTESPIDIKVLNEVRHNLHANQTIWLIDLYLQELPSYLTTIQEAITSQKGEALYLAAHKFKGASAILGAHRVVALCKTLERLGRLEVFDKAKESLLKIRTECDYLKDALEKQR